MQNHLSVMRNQDISTKGEAFANQYTLGSWFSHFSLADAPRKQ